MLKMSEFPVFNLEAIEHISSEVDVVQRKILLVKDNSDFQNITLFNVRLECQIRKQSCQNLISSNSRLKSELTNDKQNVENKRSTLATIKSSNVDLQNNFCSAEHDSAANNERMNKGVKKYQTLWLEAKARYESTPTYQQWVELSDRTERAQAACGERATKIQSLRSAIAKEKAALVKLRIARFTELSHYMKNGRSEILKQIEEKEKLKNELISKANAAKMKENVVSDAPLPVVAIEECEPREFNAWSVDSRSGDWPRLFPNLDNVGKIYEMPGLKLPELQFPMKEHNFDMSSIYTPKSAVNKRDIDLAQADIKSDPLYISYMCCFKFNRMSTCDRAPPTSAPKRGAAAVNILENRHVDEGTVNDIMSRVDAKTLKVVDKSNIKYIKTGLSRPSIVNSTINYENEAIDVIEISSPQELLLPPTQFSDKPLNGSQKKKVCFDIQESQSQVTLEGSPVEMEGGTPGGAGEGMSPGRAGEERDRDSIQLDLTNSSLDDATNFRDMYLEKRNLDSSPNFVYGKNIMLQNLTEKVVASKFFSKNNADSPEKKLSQDKPSKSSPQAPTAENDCNVLEDKDNIAINNSPAITKDEEEVAEVPKPNPRSPHARDPELSLDSLNITVNTTADDDIGHCLDASLLLSPKGEMQPPENMLENGPDTSFLSGLRKKSFSFFENTSTVTKDDINAQDSGADFSFDFASAKKKKSGGLFNIF